jgi:hypothetical protein
VAVDNFVLRYHGPHGLLLGDVNQDGSITVADVSALVRLLLREDEAPMCLADVNQDGMLTIADVTALVNRLLGR